MNTLFKLSTLSLALTTTAYAAETIPTYIGDEIVVTATRFPQPAASTPTNVTIITAADIQASGVRTLPELLARQAGISARSIDGASDFSIDLRGFGKAGDLNTVVLLDGQRLNENEDTTIKWSTIPLDAIERIEVMRGAGSVLYGAGTSGGVINIVTKSPTKQPSGMVSLGIGSYDSTEAHASLNTGHENVSLRLTGSHLETDNYRNNNHDRQSDLMGNVRFALDSGTLFVKFGGDKQTLRLPSERVVSPTQGIDELNNDRRGTSSPDDHSARNSAFLTLGWMRPLGAGELAIDVGYRNKEQQADFVRFGSYLAGESTAQSANLRYKLPYLSGSWSNTLIAGLDYADWDYGSRRATSSSAPPTADVAATQRNRSLYLLHLSQVGQTTLSAGARSEWLEQQAKDRLSTLSYAQGGQSRNVHAYEIGLKQGLAETVTLFGKIGRSYRLPVVDEIYNQWGGPLGDSMVTLLEPQRSLDREIGIQFQQDHLSLRASAYRMEVTNELHYNALTFQNMNLSPTLHQGIELEGKMQLGKGLSAFANYTYAEAKFASGNYGGTDVTGKDIPLVPRHHFNLGGAWQFQPHTSLSATLSHTGNQVFDNDQDNTFGQKIPSFTTLDMQLVQESGPWKWTLAINNLLNEKYYTYGIRSRFTAGRYNAYPMQERNGMITGVYSF